MKFCPNPDCPHYMDIGKPAEFLDEIDLCSDCGTKLKWGEADEALLDEPEPEIDPDPDPEPKESPWEVVATFDNGAQAAKARDLLREREIVAEIKLVVPQDNAAAAREVLGEEGLLPEDDSEPGPDV